MNTLNKKVGRPRAYTPEALEAKFEEYVEWVKANPVYINKVSAGEIIPVPTQRPLTLVGFCQFAKISKDTFRRYEDEFCGLLTCVRVAIEADQLEGAMVGQYNPNIVARVLPPGRDDQRQGDNGLNTAYFRGPRYRSCQDHPVHRQNDSSSKGMTGHAACDDARHRITTK